MGDLIEAEASLGAHRTVCSHSHLGRGAGGGYFKVITHKMQLIHLPGFFDIDLDVVSIVDLFLYVFIHLGHNLGLVRDLVVQCLDSSGGAVVVFSQLNEVLLVEVLDGDLVIEKW